MCVVFVVGISAIVDVVDVDVCCSWCCLVDIGAVGVGDGVGIDGCC